MDENQSNSTFTVKQGLLKIWRLGIANPPDDIYQPHPSADDRYFSVQLISVVWMHDPGFLQSLYFTLSVIRSQCKRSQRSGMIWELRATPKVNLAVLSRSWLSPATWSFSYEQFLFYRQLCADRQTNDPRTYAGPRSTTLKRNVTRI